MNSIQNNNPDDRALEQDLESLGQAYQRLGPDEPPALLDQAILNSAKRAAENKPGWMDFGWIHGLTTAAVIVLTVSIVLTQRQTPLPEQVSPMPAEATSPEPDILIERETHMQLSTERADSLAEPKRMRRSENSSGLLMDLSAMDKLEESVAAPAAVTAENETAGESMSQASKLRLEHRSIAPIGALETRFKQSQQLSVEEQLQAILKLKQAGDSRWESMLKSFITDHPGYPLPDALKN